ncbi:MAG: heparin lyase I family protein [Rhodobacteraceae bacterium]|nr:heparin lyase I family protein [Paracoccaceae bacterium]
MKEIFSLVAFVALIVAMSVFLSHHSQAEEIPIPTYSSWPPGTKAGSRGMVRNISPHKHAFARVGAPHPVRYGEMSERYELRQGDCGGSDCKNPRKRSEIREDGSNIKARLNRDTWIGWSFFNQSMPNTSLHPVIGQWKVNSEQAVIKFFQEDAMNGYSKCTSKYCNTRKFPPSKNDIFVQLDDLRVARNLGAESNWGNICHLFNLASSRGKWVDVVIRTNFGTDENGYLQIWVNGTPRCDYRGQIVASRSKFAGPSHRRGIYWSYTVDWDNATPSKAKPTMVAYYDEYRVGTSREQVDIRIIEATGGPAVD